MPAGLAIPAGAHRGHRGPPRSRADALVAEIPLVSESTADQARQAVDAVYRSDSRRVLATLIRLLGDFDLAEEALHEAFAAAVEQWPREGIPANPRAWLVSTGQFKTIDAVRRRARLDPSLKDAARRFEERVGASAVRDDQGIEDDRL